MWKKMWKNQKISSNYSQKYFGLEKSILRADIFLDALISEKDNIFSPRPKKRGQAKLKTVFADSDSTTRSNMHKSIDRKSK